MRETETQALAILIITQYIDEIVINGFWPINIRVLKPLQLCLDHFLLHIENFYVYNSNHGGRGREILY
jgi:hypothetical protein